MKNLKEKLNDYIEKGWIISQRHPSLPLTIYNYSQTTQFDKNWDEITLMCRGLVLDNEGNVVARPFKKFFNWEEIVHSASAEQMTMPFEVFDKMDGSLGVGFWYGGEFILATRGSFASDQAVKAKEILKNYRIDYLSEREGERNLTLLFEIIYPSNRIVVDYGDVEQLVLLGAIDTQTGEEKSYEDLKTIALLLKAPVVKRYDELKNFDEIKALNWDNKEGMVIRFENGYRMKIKFSDYVALHRILTQCSSYDIWENLMTFGELPKELFEKVPDEFFGWVREVRDSIMSQFNFLDALSKAEFSSNLIKLKGVPASDFDREFAALVVNSRTSGLLFSLKKMYMKQGRSTIVDENGAERWETDDELLAKQMKGYESAIWKMCKPEYSKPFADNG